MDKTKRINISLTPEEIDMVDQLAKEYAHGRQPNRSGFIGMLIRIAWRQRQIRAEIEPLLEDPNRGK